MNTWRVLLKEFATFPRFIGNVNFVETHNSANKSGEACLIISGYGGTKHFYTAMQKYFDSKGIRAYVADIGVNVRKFHASVQLVEREISRIFDKNERVTIIGHSLGGAIAAGVLALTPSGGRVKKVIALGTPFLGCPLVPLNFLIRLTTGAHERIFHKHKKKFLKVADRLITICSPYDGVAPPERCYVPGSNMTLIDISTVFPGADIGHLDLANSEEVWSLMENLLKNGYRYRKP